MKLWAVLPLLEWYYRLLLSAVLPHTAAVLPPVALGGTTAATPPKPLPKITSIHQDEERSWGCKRDVYVLIPT